MGKQRGLNKSQKNGQKTNRNTDSTEDDGACGTQDEDEMSTH